jgi:hypothetical protein
MAKLEELKAAYDAAADAIEVAIQALEGIMVDPAWGLEHETYMRCRAALRKLKETRGRTLMTKLEKLKAVYDAAEAAYEAAAARASAYANPYANRSVSARNSYFADAARDAAWAEADVAWDAYYYELKKHERTLMTNLMSKLMTKIKKLKVDWIASLKGSASVLSKLAAYEAAVYAHGDAVDAYGDAVDASRAELKKTQEENSNDH